MDEGKVIYSEFFSNDAYTVGVVATQYVEEDKRYSHYTITSMARRKFAEDYETDDQILIRWREMSTAQVIRRAIAMFDDLKSQYIAVSDDNE